ncbi:MAG: zinc ABC transporter substrate-binding protein [Paracoccaceae bacterium]
MRLISFAPVALASLLWSQPALAEAPNVLADTPVTHSLVAQVMGELGTPNLLIERAIDPHHAQLRPSQARALAQADLFVWIGAPLTPWLENKVETLLPHGAAYALLEAPETKLLVFEEGDESGEDDGEEDGEEDDHNGHDHSEGALDPHAWLNPENARNWLGAIAAQLSKSDPQNAAVYAANAARAQVALEALTPELAATLAPAKARRYIASHDAFGYLTTRFNFEIAATITDGHANAPGAAGLAALRRLIESEKVDCILAESGGTDPQAEQIAAETGLPMVALDPIGATFEAGPELYAAMMRSLAKQISTCGTSD